jgi:hypothetical protein
VVDTQKESLARILLVGKATVTVRELSRFEIREETRPDGSQRVLINLAEGKIRVMVARRLMKPGDEVEIRTPNAIAGVRGSDGIFEVSKLPDGRPQTMITGVSGEFQITLPTTPPFVARGKEFLDGPARASGSPLIAMAEMVSDAGSGLQVAQLTAALILVARLEARITGIADGTQGLATAMLTQAQVDQRGGNYRLPVGATGANQPPPETTDRVAKKGEDSALGNAAAAGLTGSGRLASAGGGGIVQPTPITPAMFVQAPPAAVSFFNQLSPGQQNLVRALFQADGATLLQNLTLEQIAQQRLSSPGQTVYDNMKANGYCCNNPGPVPPRDNTFGLMQQAYCAPGPCN